MTKRIGSRQPPLVGTSWKTCFSATKEAAIVVARETFNGPAQAGAEREKSSVSVSPSTVRSSATLSGSSERPSLSIWSSKE